MESKNKMVRSKGEKDKGSVDINYNISLTSSQKQHLQDKLDGKNERAIIPSVYSRRKNQNRELMATKKLMNNIRKRQTLARASVPRSHRHLRHRDLMTNNNNPKSSKRMKFAFKRPEPCTYARLVLDERANEINEFKAFRVELEHALLNGGIVDEKERKTLTEEVNELEGTIKDCEEARTLFENNYQHFEAKFVFAMEEAKKLDKIEDDKRKREQAREIEKNRCNREITTMTNEDKDVGTRKKTDTSHSLNDDLYQNRVIRKTPKKTIQSTLFSLPAKEKFFLSLKTGFIVTKTKRYYRDYFHDTLLPATTQVTTPGFQDTYIYKCVKEGKPIVSPNDTPTKVNNSGQLNGARGVCICGNDNFHIDSKTADSLCMKCGIVQTGPQKYVQSFAEVQASSVRNTAPYERVSHVSCFIILC